MDRSKRVLVVEDEAGIRSLLQEVLSKEGFEVRLAKDGQESLDQLEDNSFDLVITDMRMPGMDGIEMLRLMKKAGRKEKVIVMSGDPSELMLSECDVPHVVTRFEKPFRIDKFVEAVFAATDDAGGVSGADIRKLATG